MRFTKAFIGSFAVYLTPIVGPHMIAFVGEWLTHIPRRLEGNVPWALSEIGSALALQAIVFAILLGHFTRRSWITWTLLLAAVPFTIVAANLTYMLALPSYFLIDPDTREERASWKQVCSAKGWWLESARTASYAPVALLATERDYALLRMPGCEVIPLIKRNPMDGIEVIAPNGSLILRSGDKRWFWKPGAAERRLIDADSRDSAVVSNDGSTYAVLHGRELRISDLETPIALQLPELGYNMLVGLDTVQQRVLVIRDGTQLWTLGFDGKPQGTPVSFQAAGSIINNAQISNGHWVIWEGYRERGRYSVVWSRPDGGLRKHEVLSGRSITGAARTPAGRLIAVSTSTALNIGSFPDTVSVLRASDGIEIYRKRLPRYNRTQVYFPDDRHLAYTVIDGLKSEVAVFEAPIP